LEKSNDGMKECSEFRERYGRIQNFWMEISSWVATWSFRKHAVLGKFRI